MQKKHYIIIAVAIVALWYFFLREKKEQPVSAVTPIPRPASPPAKDALETVNGSTRIPQNTALAMRRPAADNKVIAGINVGPTRPSSSRTFGNYNQARQYYRDNGGANCQFIELGNNQFEVNCP